MKLKDMKGMRDIPTIQGLKHRGVPASREQAVSELARLEHEKARLQRELHMWMENQQKTEGRLRQVEERLALLEQALNPPAAEAPSEHARAGTSHAQRSDGDEEGSRGWREVRLEY